MQMPITGTPAAARSRTSSSKASARTSSIARGIAPTPGSATPAAPRTTSWSRVRTASTPTCAKAFSTERRLPIP